MYSLNTLRKINARAAEAPRGEDTFSRHCSHCVNVKTDPEPGVVSRSVVIHSAKHRNTAYLEGKRAENLLVALQASNSVVEHDRLIEEAYNGVPVGKQQVVSA